MAAEKIESPPNIANILNSLCLPYELVTNKDEEAGYIAELRTALPQEASHSHQCDKWISMFSSLTNTNWIVAKTFPNARVMYKYRKLYLCHHSDRYKTKDSPKKTTPNKGLGCRASVDIIIKKSTVHTRSKDKFTRKGLDTLIKVKFTHSHPLNGQDTLSHLKMTEETKSLFYSFFELGMSVPEAKRQHKQLIMSTRYSGNETGSLDSVEDSALFPKAKQIYHLYYKWRKEVAKEQRASDEVPRPSSGMDHSPSFGMSACSPEMITVGYSPEGAAADNVEAEAVLTEPSEEEQPEAMTAEREAVLKDLAENLQKIAFFARNMPVESLRSIVESFQLIGTPEQLEKYAFSMKHFQAT